MLAVLPLSLIVLTVIRLKEITREISHLKNI